MSKSTNPQQATLFCGIDVSAATLAVAVIDPDQPFQQREFANRSSSHRSLIGWLHMFAGLVHVSLEVTGICSLDLALDLNAAPHIELAVLNPKMVNRFAQTLRRSKTDAADAQVLAEYSRRMPFLGMDAAQPKRASIARGGPSYRRSGCSARPCSEPAACGRKSLAVPSCVLQDLKRSLASLERRIVKMHRAARELIRADAGIEQRFRLLICMPGIAETSALAILGELALLSPHLTARQWVAHSGSRTAGSTRCIRNRAPQCISAPISAVQATVTCAALHMPTLAAVRWDPHMKAFYEALQHRHKTKLQAIVAVARKLLHSIYGIFCSQTPYDGSKLFPQMEIT